MATKKTAILVTGGTGNIGAWVTRRLVSEGLFPVVYDLRPDTTYLKDISDKLAMVAGDVADFNKINETLKEHQVQRVIHLAKFLGFRCEENPRRAVEVNVLGSANVLDAARVNGIRRVAFASSKSVYAAVTGKHAYPEMVPMTEDWPKFDREENTYVPFYSTTNKMVEYFGIRMAMKYNLEFVIMRFGQVWGPGKMAAQIKYGEESQKLTSAFAASKMIDDALAGKPTHLTEGGSPEDSDDIVYNKDAAQGVVKACLSDSVKFDGNHREFHFGSGRALNLSHFAAALQPHFPGLNIQVESKPVQQHLHRAANHAILDITRARTELAYEPQFGDPVKAVADYIETEQTLKK